MRRGRGEMVEGGGRRWERENVCVPQSIYCGAGLRYREVCLCKKCSARLPRAAELREHVWVGGFENETNESREARFVFVPLVWQIKTFPNCSSTTQCRVQTCSAFSSSC